jgi:hypothetical protein
MLPFAGFFAIRFFSDNVLSPVDIFCPFIQPHAHPPPHT